MDEMLLNGGLAMLILEIVKWVIRYVKKDPNYNFPTIFYGVAIPVLNILVIPLLALLGVQSVSLPTDWVGWIRSAMLVGVSSLVSLLFYGGGYKKLKDYNTALKDAKALEEGEG